MGFLDFNKSKSVTETTNLVEENITTDEMAATDDAVIIRDGGMAASDDAVLIQDAGDFSVDQSHNTSIISSDPDVISAGLSVAGDVIEDAIAANVDAVSFAERLTEDVIRSQERIADETRRTAQLAIDKGNDIAAEAMHQVTSSQRNILSTATSLANMGVNSNREILKSQSDILDAAFDFTEDALDNNAKLSEKQVTTNQNFLSDFIGDYFTSQTSEELQSTALITEAGKFVAIAIAVTVTAIIIFKR